jgi:conjugative relaxase-like TrwC/TraI family protein
VLTVTALTNAEYLLGSVALGIDEYYMGVGEAPGVWMGHWSPVLGLEGVVEADALRALIDGNDPTTGAPLLVGLRERKVKAFDLTFSAPKGASLLWALGSEAVADVVMAAHREAVATALEFLEERAALARIQVDGLRRHVPTEGWAVAGFVHRTSRAGDPQLHTHCLVPNVVRRDDGRCVAIAARPMFMWARAAGSIYQAELQRLLSLRLGVEWQPDRNNTREIAGFTPESLRTFSKRSIEIEAELEATGASYEAPALRMRADNQASLATRPAKDHTATPRLLFGRWQGEAAEIGLEIGTALEARVCWRDPDLRAVEFEEIARRLIDDEHGLCAHSARFAEHDVIAHVAGLAAGRLSTIEITDIAERFLGSDLVVRLTPTASKSGWEPARWSTVDQRNIEDDTLVILDRLTARAGTPIPAPTVAERLRAVGFFGADQCQAVSVLCGPGGSVRTVLAPAGYGKTAMAHVAAGCATADGRPVIAVATTAKAVAELDAAGLSARTIARLRYDLCDGPLPTGAVVILDEISQTSTLDAHSVLAAVDACPGGQLWVLGDPRQAPSVKAGGIAAEIEARADAATIPAAWLTVNRRQADSDDRHALGVLRCGDAFASQQLRREHGWEHTEATPEDTRRAMADAVTTDIRVYGPDNTIALVVSHAQAEDITDRIRRRLTDTGTITGTSITGPGWTSDRRYQTGDRMLLHTRHGDRHSPLVNGTVGTITTVNEQGVLFQPDRGQPVRLPAGFIQGTRADGAPNVSHAWARTVDGAQGGTWDHVHLLGTAALDAYRGYTAQSRSVQPTHTWNTANLPSIDFGGRLAHDLDPDDQVAAALSRIPDTTMAAVNDPWTIDTQLRELIATHQDVLDRQPPDRQRQLDHACHRLAAARTRLDSADTAVDNARSALDGIGVLAPLSRSGRAQRREFEKKLSSRRDAAIDAAGAVATADADVARLTREQAAHDRHEHDHGWRRGAIDNTWELLNQHWTDVALACVRADQTLAYGVEPLRIGRRHLADQLAPIEASLPPDLSAHRELARTTLRTNSTARYDAEQRLARSQAALDEQLACRWPRRDKTAIAQSTNDVHNARQLVADTQGNENTARQHLADLDLHQKTRAAELAATAPQRHALSHDIAQLDTALHHTRTDRVLQLADHPTQLHLDLLGPVPTGTAGRAVWCHQATRLERHLDHVISDDSMWQRLVNGLSITPTLARIAERHNAIPPHHQLGPTDWAPITQHAEAIHAATIEHARPAPQHALELDLGF